MSQNCSPKWFPEAAIPKHLCKAVVPKLLCFKSDLQSGIPKLFSKAVPESCFPKLKLPKAAPQMRVPKLIHKIVPRNYGFSKLLFKYAVQIYSSKLLLLQSCSPSLLHKISQNCFPKLLSYFLKRFPASAAQSCSPTHRRKAFAPKLLCPKAAPENYFAKLSPKIPPKNCALKPIPKITIFNLSIRNCRIRMFLNAVPISQLLPKIIPQRYYRE